MHDLESAKPFASAHWPQRDAEMKGYSSSVNGILTQTYVIT